MKSLIGFALMTISSSRLCFVGRTKIGRADGTAANKKSSFLKHTKSIKQKIFEKYKVFLSKRYVRIGGKILSLYIALTLLQMPKIFGQLREVASHILGEEIALVAVKSFGIKEKDFDHVFDYFAISPRTRLSGVRSLPTNKITPWCNIRLRRISQKYFGQKICTLTLSVGYASLG